MVIDHDAGSRMVADDIAEGPHTLEFAVIAHDDEVGSFNDRAHLVLVTFVNEDFLCAWNPFQKIGENGGSYDMDVSFGQSAPEPGSKGSCGTYGISIGASVTGDDDVPGGR